MIQFQILNKTFIIKGFRTAGHIAYRLKETIIWR